MEGPEANRNMMETELKSFLCECCLPTYTQELELSGAVVNKADNDGSCIPACYFPPPKIMGDKGESVKNHSSGPKDRQGQFSSARRYFERDFKLWTRQQ